MLFVKAIDKIVADDVVAFCDQRIAEGLHLDYKGDLTDNAKLSKTIAAFANAHGGLVLIGVEDDKKENKPVLPVQGIPFSRDLEGRIQSIILDRIHPPVFCETRPVPLANGNCVVLIRVPESAETPHTIDQRRSIVIRTGNRTQSYEEPADLDQIEWLLNRRRKTEELRERLIASTKRRAANIWDIECRAVEQRAKAEGKPSPGIVTPAPGMGFLYIVPLYPPRHFLGADALCDQIPKFAIRDYFGRFNDFPPQPHNFTIGQSNCYSKGDPFGFWYCEFHTLGLFGFQESFWKVQGQDEGIWFAQVVARIDEFLEVAVSYYQAVGHWGCLKFGFGLSQILGARLLLPQRVLMAGNPTLSPDSECSVERTWTLPQLQAERGALVNMISQEVAWHFGWKIGHKTIEGLLAEMRR